MVCFPPTCSKLNRKVINGSNDASQEDGEPSTSCANTVSISTQTEKMTFEDVNSIADHLLSQTKIRPEIGIICGSGLGNLVEDLDKDRDRDELPYKDIPNFPVTTGRVCAQKYWQPWESVYCTNQRIVILGMY